MLAGLERQPLFLAILGAEAALQVAIVQAGGRVFSTVPLSGPLWGVCVGFGAGSLVVGAALRVAAGGEQHGRQQRRLA